MRMKKRVMPAVCIPLALNGRDICGSMITGSGKTATYALPTLERLLYRPKRVSAVRVLIFTPARELAVQAQESTLRVRPDIVVATPRHMIVHLGNSMSVDLDDLAVLILDEADRLLELRFSAKIHELAYLCPKKRQTTLVSTTMT
ncbi:hypothetical protein REPUB_Repub10bG0074800 [Reevesia pubescens]